MTHSSTWHLLHVVTGRRTVTYTSQSSIVDAAFKTQQWRWWRWWWWWWCRMATTFSRSPLSEASTGDNHPTAVSGARLTNDDGGAETNLSTATGLRTGERARRELRVLHAQLSHSDCVAFTVNVPLSLSLSLSLCTVYKARFPFKRNHLCCVRCVNENRKKRKRLRWQTANHGCHCFDRVFLLAGTCVCCVKCSRNKHKRQPIGMLGRSSGNHVWLLANSSDCVWMETGLESVSVRSLCI